MKSALALQIIDRLTKQIEELVGAKMESEKLQEERDRLKEVCSRLFSENESLKVCNNDLTKERDRLIEELKEQIKHLEREVRKRDEFIDNNTPSNVNELTEERDGESSAHVLQKGDYVLATRWSDGDPNDPFCIGFFDGFARGECRPTGIHGQELPMEYRIVDAEGNLLMSRQFKRAEKIAPAIGVWILENIKAFKMGGGDSLWGVVKALSGEKDDAMANPQSATTDID